MATQYENESRIGTNNTKKRYIANKQILQNEMLNLTSNLINTGKMAIRKSLIPERLEEIELLNLWQDTEKQRLTENLVSIKYDH